MACSRKAEGRPVPTVLPRGWMSCAIVFLLFLLLQGSPAEATTLLYQNFDDLVSKAEAIVIGTVQKTEAHPGDGQKTFTFVTLTDLQVIFGDYHQSSLVLRLLGGEAEGRGMIVVGSPVFRSNDRVLLFLRGNGINPVPIVGWSQGIFKIALDSISQQEIVTDNVGNRIFGIKENELIKEHKQPDEEAHILGGKSSSAIPFVSPGVNEDGSIPVVVGEKPAEPDLLPLSLGEFLELVNKKIAQRQKTSVPVKSVEIPGSCE